MATSTIPKPYQSSFVKRTASADAVSVAADGANDWYINYSKFGSSGTPLALCAYYLTGTGVSRFALYNVRLDDSNSRVQIAARNYDTQARTIGVTVTVLFLE